MDSAAQARSREADYRACCLDGASQVQDSGQYVDIRELGQPE